MKTLLRIMLAMYSFCLAVISAIVMLIAIRPVILDNIYSHISTYILPNRGASIAMFITALAFFILSLVFLLSGYGNARDKKAVSKHTDIGEIKISLSSIEHLALNAARRINGIKDTRAYVSKEADGIIIAMRVVVMPEINMPSLSEELQGKIKKSVEESSGIAVKEVKVIIDGIYSGSGYKPRVE